MIECDVPLELAFALWEDRGRIPQWMPWITSVVVRPACTHASSPFCLQHNVQAWWAWACRPVCCAVTADVADRCPDCPSAAHLSTSRCLYYLITYTQVQEEDPRLSRWTLSTFQFGRQWEFSWLALNLTPLRNQKIHWRSVPGSTAGSLGGALDVQNRCGWGAREVKS